MATDKYLTAREPVDQIIRKLICGEIVCTSLQDDHAGACTLCQEAALSVIGGLSAAGYKIVKFRQTQRPEFQYRTEE